MVPFKSFCLLPDANTHKINILASASQQTNPPPATSSLLATLYNSGRYVAEPVVTLRGDTAHVLNTDALSTIDHHPLA